MQRTRVFISTLIACSLFFGAPLMAAGVPTVFVSILPQKYFVQQIGGDDFHVEVMVEPGVSPHTYEPKPSQMRKLSDARAFFTIGVQLEGVWLDKIRTINPDLEVIHTEAGIEKMKMEGHHQHEDAHDDHHDAEGDGLDPHIWLSPELVKQQVKTIADSLTTLDPAGADRYRENYDRFAARVDELDGQLEEMLKGKQEKRFMVFHPSWGYFAHSYGLDQIAVEVEGKSPKPAHLKELIDLAADLHISVIFAQPQFSQKSADMIAREIGGEVILIDPLAEDWFANMTQVADSLTRALR